MKNRMALVLAPTLLMTACGENKHSETLTGPAVQGDLLASPISSDAMAAGEGVCAPVDLAGVVISEKIRFSAKPPVSCASKKAVLLAKYPSTVFPSVSGVTCVLLRSQEEFAKYGDFSFRCTGSAVVFPSLGGEFVLDVPVARSLDVASVKMRLLPE